MEDYRYSVAIRTLGTNARELRKTIHSLRAQTVPPKQIVCYIAYGYPCPAVGDDDVVFVRTGKGFVTQRALDYKEIGTELILLLDDDISFSNDSLRLLLHQFSNLQADAIVCDAYNHYRRGIMKKFAAIMNGAVPVLNSRYSYKVLPWGGFAFCANPRSNFMPTQTGNGAAILTTKKVLSDINLTEETWIDMYKYASGEDLLLVYKMFLNGYAVFNAHECGMQHNDARTGSKQKYENTVKEISSCQYIIWHRCCFSLSCRKWLHAFYFGVVVLLRCLLYLILSIKHNNLFIIYSYICGIRNGVVFTNSSRYLSLTPFKYK